MNTRVLCDNAKTKRQILASLPYPETGASQHLCIVRTEKSVSPAAAGLLLDWRDLDRTVLASAFVDADVTLSTPLPAPLHRIPLPPLTRAELREKPVADAEGRPIGMLLQVPGLWCCANRLLLNHRNGSTAYNYRSGIHQLTVEAARLLASTLKRGVLRVREKPGIMAHALAVPELAPDEVGISETWAAKVLSALDLGLQSLDGFPVWAIRYPIANEWGIQPCVLRVLPGTGRYLGFNPWNLAKRLLGDCDGDQGYVLLRKAEWLDGRVAIARRPRIHTDRKIERLRGRLTAQNLFQPPLLQEELGLSEKAMAKIEARYETRELRLGAILDSDVRELVAVFTVIAWNVARTLAASGIGARHAAYRRAFNAIEPILESAFDSRKAGEGFSGGAADAYRFAEALMGGGDLPAATMERLGVPAGAIDTLRLAWALSDNNVGRRANRSPIYHALVSQGKNLENSCRELLGALEAGGVRAEDVYATIVKDLACQEVFYAD